MKQEVIISRLLDKYEKSKHLFEPGASNRRVMLRVEKKELPEYDYQDAVVRDEFNDTVTKLEKEGMVFTEWVAGRPVLSCVILNLENVMQCYRLIGRTHPKELAVTVANTVTTQLSYISTDWIIAWRNDVCAEARDTFSVPAYCKNDFTLLADLITAFDVYDSLHGEPITMRAFSSKCYHDTKHFEREIRDSFLRIARKYNTGLGEICEQGELGIRDQLAYLGIYARPELYEFAGNCAIITAAGTVNAAALVPYGLALPSTLIDSITSIDLNKIHKIVFIENKTNYDAYILSELQWGTLAIYHGGFLSPQKRKFFAKIAEFISQDTAVYLWADIDLGGFRMFQRLQQIFPCLRPMRMSAEDVVAHQKNGLKRSDDYLELLRIIQEGNELPIFHGAIQRILEYGVTIEQEVFLIQ